MSTQSSVVFTATSFSWPDGDPVLADCAVAFGVGRTGLIGANGSGKTTLLRLIAGEITPTSGSITTQGSVGYLPQQLTARVDTTVAELMGIRTALDALRAIERGDTDPVHFDALGDQWDVEARAAAVLDDSGLSHVDLDRRIGSLSGGETIVAALAGLRLADTGIVLLDEPTNNLDRSARARLYDAIDGWRRTLIVVSHDLQLLEFMDDTAELRDARVAVFGGPYSAYREHLAREQAAAEQAVRAAEQTLRVEKRQRIEAETKLARRSRYAKTDYENKRRPKVVMKQRATEAQVSAGKLRGEMAEKAQAAQHAVDDASDRVRRDIRIRIDLPDPDVPASKQLAEFHDGDLALHLQGPERWALVGPNGIGKTRLLNNLVYGEPRPSQSSVSSTLHIARVGYMPQRLVLDEAVTVLDAVRAAAPSRTTGELRAMLARFLIRGDGVDRPVGSLSGGERFRVALVRLLSADPPNQLLVLDEPTNNLDLVSVDVLVDALDAYRGGLLIVSHDDAFLSRLRIDATITLTRDGIDPTRPHPHVPEAT